MTGGGYQVGQAGSPLVVSRNATVNGGLTGYGQIFNLHRRGGWERLPYRVQKHIRELTRGEMSSRYTRGDSGRVVRHALQVSLAPSHPPT